MCVILSHTYDSRDSMGNVEILKRGDLQLTSAGTGIAHSEKTYGDREVHFLQIWSLPSASRLEPKYYTRYVSPLQRKKRTDAPTTDCESRNFTDTEKQDAWALVVAPASSSPHVALTRTGSGPAPVQSPLHLYATLLSPKRALAHAVRGTRAYVHVVQTSGYNGNRPGGAAVRITGEKGTETALLREGDGLYVHAPPGGENVLEVNNEGDRVAEVLLFDLD
jgi:quercetin 2,3-dioxygenase